MAGGCAGIFRPWRRMPHGLSFPADAADLHGDRPGGSLSDYRHPAPDARHPEQLPVGAVSAQPRRTAPRNGHRRRARRHVGIRRRLAPLMDNDRRKIELMNSLLLSFPGTPIIYYGDEIGMGDNIYLGIRRRLAPLMDNDRRKIELMNSLLLSFPGTPIIYYGDEIGMGDNIYLGDRNGVRTPM